METHTFICISLPMVQAGAILIPGAEYVGPCSRCWSLCALSQANRRYRDKLQREGDTTQLICLECLEKEPGELEEAMEHFDLAPGTLQELRAYFSRN